MQPVEFTAGQAVGSGGIKAPEGDSAGGLFSGASGPKPPAALSQAVIGMKAGGKVSAAVLSSRLLDSFNSFHFIHACMHACMHSVSQACRQAASPNACRTGSLGQLGMYWSNVLSATSSVLC